MLKKYGYMGKILFVDLDNSNIQEEDLSWDIARDYVGGYGIGVRLIMERMEAGSDPFGPENIFGIGTGPFTLSGVPSTCRFTTMGKSPLTGYWGDANSGGNFANALKSSGYDLVLFRGKADHPVYLQIVDGKPEIKDARHLWGRDTAQTEDIIKKESGNSRFKIITIGTAGERLSRIAAVINDKGRAAARSGLGGVMGSKNLKAVSCAGSGKPAIFDRKKIQDMIRWMLKNAKEKPSGMFLGLSTTGTAGAIVHHFMDHDVPIKNWGGNNVEDFPREKWELVSWSSLEKYVTKKYACTGCPIACGHLITVNEGKYKVKNGHKPEYETAASFGPMCLNDNMESLIYANELCNRHGLDTISAGATIAFAIECFENGIISKKDTDGIELRWGKSDAVIEVLKKMCLREGIGDILAEGAKVASEKIGGGAEQFAMNVGGEMLPMHDPRCFPGWGATYVSDPTPARHVKGGTAFAEGGPVANEIVYNALGVPIKMERYDTANKGKWHAIMAGWQHWVNTSGACLFAVDAMSFPFMDFMRALTGWDLDWGELEKTGRRIATILHAFNLREGFKPTDFTMPRRVNGDPPFKVGDLQGITIDTEGLKRQYYEAMGFDPKTGEIRKEVIDELGLRGLI